MLPTHDDVDIIRCLPHSDCGKKRAQKEAVLDSTFRQRVRSPRAMGGERERGR